MVNMKLEVDGGRVHGISQCRQFYLGINFLLFSIEFPLFQNSRTLSLIHGPFYLRSIYLSISLFFVLSFSRMKMRIFKTASVIQPTFSITRLYVSCFLSLSHLQHIIPTEVEHALIWIRIDTFLDKKIDNTHTHMLKIYPQLNHHRLCFMTNKMIICTQSNQ